MEKKIKIGYRLFKIEPFPNGFGEKLDGETDFQKLTIRIHSDLDSSIQASTLLHEIMHVLYEEYGLVKEDTEERIVTTLSNGLCRVIQDNSWLVNFLNKGLRL